VFVLVFTFDTGVFRAGVTVHGIVNVLLACLVWVRYVIYLIWRANKINFLLCVIVLSIEAPDKYRSSVCSRRSIFYKRLVFQNKRHKRLIHTVVIGVNFNGTMWVLGKTLLLKNILNNSTVFEELLFVSLKCSAK